MTHDGYRSGFLDLVETAGYDAGADALTVTGFDGRILLRIGPAPEYRWELAPEDAPEAARIFAECVRDRFMQWHFLEPPA